MSKKMLIDASHPEETRVVVVDGTRVEELDFESANKRQLRGNVYLARVTRVEPSLQAAFVEYGGNRHGFLAFSEIHPDYYQIPHDDRVALQKDEEEAVKEADAAEEARASKSRNRKAAVSKESAELDDTEDDISDEDEDDTDEDASDDISEDDVDENVDPTEEDTADETDAEVAAEQVKTASTRRSRVSRRRYKIQEVIKRGDILLIQAVKEERGNKGAAMTTYLSLAGRYCVLMPNTPRGGGISRKISNGSDRKRLKEIVGGLDVAKGMGVIVRTAGSKRTKIEIKRDFDYLTRLWDTIRETTMNSFAPALIHEEGNLVKRSLRDLYNKDIEEVLVQGEDEYKVAKNFIKMMMPSHAKNIKQYVDDIPLFLRYQVEHQIEDSLSPVAQLKSGGYLVIHPTEALVSVDVNSGRSTKERNVERTALKTNLEAAEEVARQMRMRDLAGLIVIDFIDMDENKNNRAVERRMKDALAQDRARVQMGRISQFGLMEISRQRRRRSLLEGSTQSCEHCEGVGRKRTIESSALKALRAVEEEGVRSKTARVRLTVGMDVANYLINEKRHLLTEIEERTGLFVELVGEIDLLRPEFKIDKLEMRAEKGADPLEEIAKEHRKQAQRKPKKSRNERSSKNDADSDENGSDAEGRGEKSSRSHDGDGEGDGKRRRRRRGRRGGSRRNKSGENTSENSTESQDSGEPKSDSSENQTGDKDAAKHEANDGAPKRTRRRRGGSRSKSETSNSEDSSNSEEASEAKQDDKPKGSTTRRRAPAKKTPADTKPEIKPETKFEPKDDKPNDDAPKRRRRAPAKAKTGNAVVKADTAPDAKSDATDKPKVKSTTTRKAPARKPAAKAKAPAKKAAPKAKAKAKPEAEAKADPKTEAKTETKKASTVRRKAPSRASAETPAKAAPKAKAPAKPKAAVKAKPAAKAKAKPAAKSKDTEKDKGENTSKRKGWWSRKS